MVRSVPAPDRGVAVLIDTIDTVGVAVLIDTIDTVGVAGPVDSAGSLNLGAADLILSPRRVGDDGAESAGDAARHLADAAKPSRSRRLPHIALLAMP